ncbi:MAG: hypothetical protein EBX36_01620 [Planctomycetia bacterium]|nr:hypothetical protein [Planctomycetia bacterium]
MSGSEPVCPIAGRPPRAMSLTPSACQSWPRSPLGCCCGWNIAIGPPGPRRGCAVPGTPCISTGSGSSNTATGCPERTAATKWFICSGPSVEGCTASSTS